jgi:hypothetical protein
MAAWQQAESGGGVVSDGNKRENSVERENVREIEGARDGGATLSWRAGQNPARQQSSCVAGVVELGRELRKKNRLYPDRNCNCDCNHRFLIL